MVQMLQKKHKKNKIQHNMAHHQTPSRRYAPARAQVMRVVKPVHPCTFGRGTYSRFGTVFNSKYKVTPSTSPKLPLVASSRRQLLIFAETLDEIFTRFTKNLRLGVSSNNA